MRCVDALGSVQASKGEWPWFYLSPSGQVMDMYQVYSVHQDGMAPAYLHHAIKHGHPTAQEQITKGFHWILGENEMKQSMLRPKYGVIVRAQMRREPGERFLRAFRATYHWMKDKEGDFIGAQKLKLNNECRSYHLGWVLWSFGGRDGFQELTHHQAFHSEK